MRRMLAIAIARLAANASCLAGNAGTSLPGMWATKAHPQILSILASEVERGIIIVTGTNGKTTTANLIAHILTNAGRRVVSNKIGSNMYNGVVSTFLLAAPLTGRLDADYAVLEVDELYTMPVCAQVTPRYFVVTNLFSDQIDRFGSVAEVRQALAHALNDIVSSKTTLVLNADNQESAQLAQMVPLNTTFFSVEQNGPFMASDITEDDGLAFVAHTPDGDVGIDAHIRGDYNVSNMMAAIAVASQEGVSLNTIAQSIATFETQPGRMESFVVDGKSVILNMTKNPAGVNSTLKSAAASEVPYDVFIVVNNTPADGEDVSWYRDIEFERYAQRGPATYYVSGTCVNEMASRLRKAGVGAHSIRTIPDAATGLHQALQGSGEVLYALANYSAVFPLRKLLITSAEAER